MPYVIIGLVALGLVLGLWLALGREPRRHRAYKRAQRLLQEKAWQEALALVDKLLAEPGLSPVWQQRLRHAAGECHHVAADLGLKEKSYEDSLQHYLAAAPLLGVDPEELRTRVIDAMLAEIRRLFAETTGSAGTEAVEQLVARTQTLQSPCPEAMFWQALCHVRHGHVGQALTALTAAHELAGKRFIDPALYLGILLHGEGRSSEALRYLAEANRLDASCPFVTWQMGVALVGAGGDSLLAVRALQRALGPRGLGLWSQAPARAWVEAFPEGRSFVRRLASKHPYVCPILGGDLTVIVRLGQLALAQALYRQERFQESADLYGKLLQESPPTVVLLRGYGLALARLQRYDQAYKHLRIALEREEPQEPFTAGYLALCGAMGKPTQPEDKPKNVAWAIRLLARFDLPGNAEWAGLYSAVYAEARALGMAVAVEDEVRLCDTLASIHAVDPTAAAAYAHLAAHYPDAVRPVYAWLYCQAARVHGFISDQDLDLFARTFRDSAPARTYFAERNWDFGEVEYTYLERSAARCPGRLPDELGPEYAPRGEAFLLERSRREEEAGRNDSAISSGEVLLRLLPRSVAGHDRLACLHYRRGDLDRAVGLLSDWQRLAPHDHWPLVRQAIIEQQRGNAERRTEAINQALGLTRGPLRAAVAFLGARLTLQSRVREVPAPNASEGPSSLATASALLQECLKEQPDHVEALWCLAAVRSEIGDREGLAAQAAVMNKPAIADSRFHYLGAVCHLAARDYAGVLELAERSAADEALAADSLYLMAWAHLTRGDEAAARAALRKVVDEGKGESIEHARALLGRCSLTDGDYEEAVQWWTRMDARRRADWGLDEPLRQTVLLSGLLAYEEGRFEPAADRFREASRLGLRDRRLGSLIVLALFKAGQRLLYSEEVISH
jgi:tetratricopeptide (TPR) repeat protein